VLSSAQCSRHSERHRHRCGRARDRIEAMIIRLLSSRSLVVQIFGRICCSSSSEAERLRNAAFPVLSVFHLRDYGSGSPHSQGLFARDERPKMRDAHPHPALSHRREIAVSPHHGAAVPS
jgi:hypothetical protein